MVYNPDIHHRRSIRLRDYNYADAGARKAVLSEEELFAFVPMVAVGAADGSIDVSAKRPFAEVRKGLTPFQSGDVLFAKITPCMENGKMVVVPQLENRYGFGSTEFHVIRPKDGIDPKYVYHYVEGREPGGLGQSPGTRRHPTGHHRGPGGCAGATATDSRGCGGGELMQERLQKILAQAGIASRREAETIITAGRVAVNGKVVTELGTKADPHRDRITVDGKPVRLEERKLYILLYKPVGYMTTLKDPQGRPIVTDLLKEVKERVYPVGRLDYNTEGLLLLTNDGAWANQLAHPRHEVDKEYLVKIRGRAGREQLRQLAEGVELDDGRTAPARVSLVHESDKNSWISVTIHEGRYRQVRRMCEAVSLSVVRLKRARYGPLELGELKPGQYRLLTAVEVEELKKAGR